MEIGWVATVEVEANVREESKFDLKVKVMDESTEVKVKAKVGCESGSEPPQSEALSEVKLTATDSTCGAAPPASSTDPASTLEAA